MLTIEIATWLIAVAYVGAFLVLTAQAGREANRPVWLFGKGGSAQKWPAMLFRLTFIGLVVWPPLSHWSGASQALEFSHVDSLMKVAGNLFAAVGAAIGVASQAYMGRSWRIGAVEGEIGAIVRTGPFAMSRNPVFVGQFLLFLGVWLTNPDPFQLVILLAVIIAIRWQVAIEEPVLAASFGPEYDDYRLRVRRWV